MAQMNFVVHRTFNSIVSAENNTHSVNKHARALYANAIVYARVSGRQPNVLQVASKETKDSA